MVKLLTAKQPKNSTPKDIMAFAEIGWKKLLMISAKVCALTLALPTMVGSRCMHFSQLLQMLSIAGTRDSGLSHLLSRKSRAHMAISTRISEAASFDFSLTSDRMVDQKA